VQVRALLPEVFARIAVRVVRHRTVTGRT
jgi:hypothetical protein